GFGGGTLAPFLRASDRPMAMACFRLFTFAPLPPLRRVPRFMRCMALCTVSCDFLPYLRLVLFLAGIRNGFRCRDGTCPCARRPCAAAALRSCAAANARPCDAFWAWA